MQQTPLPVHPKRRVFRHSEEISSINRDIQSARIALADHGYRLQKVIRSPRWYIFALDNTPAGTITRVNRTWQLAGMPDPVARILIPLLGGGNGNG